MPRMASPGPPRAEAGAAPGQRGGDHGNGREESPYVELDRSAWAELGTGAEAPLSAAEIRELRGVNSTLDLDEVQQVYLPLSRLLSLYVESAGRLHRQQEQFLRRSQPPRTPFVIGLAGSVAVGKSTTARVLQQMLAHWPEHPNVALVTTDGFLLPNAELDRRGLMGRKGFPESYDTPALLRFLADIKAGKREVEAPVYSHLTYDVVEGESIRVERPDILILEGLNVLQPARLPRDGAAIPFVSDYFDFSIYLDADETLLHAWYVGRFMRLRDTAFRDPASYFRKNAEIPHEDAVEMAERLWSEINLVNLRENILPTRRRAGLILRKGPYHAIEEVALRRL